MGPVAALLSGMAVGKTKMFSSVCVSSAAAEGAGVAVRTGTGVGVVTTGRPCSSSVSTTVRRMSTSSMCWKSTLGMALVRELVIYAYQYFGTARIEGIYFLNILIRTLLTTALCMLLGPVESRIVLGRGARYRRTSAKREVKSF